MARRFPALMRRKSVEASLASVDDPERSLTRTLNAWDLAVLGVAVAVGAGIFSVGAQAAANFAGPAVIVSFVIASIVCALAMMCYAEFASSLPVAGSAYTFSYASMGELVAWIIGWDLILEMLLAAAVIAKFWGVYLADAFRLFGVHIDTQLHLGPVDLAWGPVVVVSLFTVLLVIGTKLSTRVNSVFTVIKIAITLFVIVAGFAYIKASNYTPFLPDAQPAPDKSTVDQSLISVILGQSPTMYGVFGVLSGAAVVFFAFIGFDVVATTAEEVKNPQRTLPKGILGGLSIVTVLYVLVTLVVTGMVSYDQLADTAAAEHTDPSLALAFEIVGANWAGKVISVGILIGLTTVIMVLLLGLTRIVFAMSRDGLLPRSISRTSKRFHTPVRLQIGVGAAVAIIAGLTTAEVLQNMINIGTLSAFVLVCFGVPILRKRRPDVERSFRVPWSPVLPILGGVACIWLATNLEVLTWIRFGVWIVVGLGIYGFYGYRHSLAGKDGRATVATGADAPGDAARGAGSDRD